MLYVFHVDTGRMIKFDMNVALSSVQNLKDMIERLHGLPAANLVLLVSGGEMLTSGSLVCSYSAGTDTNPIYMFSTIDTKPQPWPSIEPDVDLKDQVERCLSLPATYSTVVTRAQVAQQIYDLARDEESICEKLVHEQHLQQQGWSAVIANMEDLTDEFRQRFDNFCKCFDEHLSRRNEYLELLGQFNDALESLARIPILPGLMQNAEEEFHGFDEILDNDEIFTRTQNNSSMTKDQLLKSTKDQTADSYQVSSDTSKNRNLTLLQWISAKENHKTLKIMAEECTQGLSTFDEEKIDGLKNEVLNVVKAAEQDEIKEIKGLEDRLCGLEKLMFELKKIVQEQKELATAFQQNQNRASNLGDASILPDLCASHRSQLVVMLQNQKIIRDIRRRISRAKEELAANLNRRLKYIIQIENRMSELDNNLLFYHRCLRRVERHLNIIQQIHQTPNIYVQAVTEVFRRRQFSNAFISWASNLSYDLLTIHNDEIERRQEFNAIFEGHFLNSLFPGMNDMPPAFTSEAPYIFDASLPNITKNDIELLFSYLPEITSKTERIDMGSVIEFFALRSGNKNEKGSSSVRSQSAGMESGPVVHRPIDMHAHLKDGFESETDTEEFEKVGQSPNECQLTTTATATASTSTNQILPLTASISTSTEPLITHTVETLTEENLGSTRLEVERLKSILKKMSQISYESLNDLKIDLESLKKECDNEKSELQGDFNVISDEIIKFKECYESKEKEIIDKMNASHQIEIEKILKHLEIKDEIIDDLNNKKLSFETSHAEYVQEFENERKTFQDQISDLKIKIETILDELKKTEIEREKAVLECRDRLIHEHKTELESLRCRFKLMTSMERSPSDTSLEKIERHDMMEIACHELILHQTREDLIREKEIAIKLAIERERSQNSLNIASNDLVKKIIDEKEKLLDSLRERDLMLSKENSQLKIKIEALANEEESDRVWLKDKIEFLNRDKNRLEQELSIEKSKRLEMESSMATLKGSYSSRDSVASPDILSCKGKSPSSLTKLGVMTESCSKGDTVIVIWNNKHGQYVIVQESPTLYFLHGDSHIMLNLKMPKNTETAIPDTFFAIGRVIEKEYCHARKDENRYKVTKGTKFYRVKVQPLSMTSRWHHKRDRHESTSSSCTSVSRSTSTQHLIDSFAQTDLSPGNIGRDMVDSVEVKDRIEEDDDILSGQCRYISLSEGEESGIGTQTLNDEEIASKILQNPIESSLEKDQDDSDEYRSLEAKDENHFPTVV